MSIVVHIWAVNGGIVPGSRDEEHMPTLQSEARYEYGSNIKRETALIVVTIYWKVRAVVRASIVHQLQNSAGDRYGGSISFGGAL